MTTSLRNVPERAVEPNINEDKSREYFRAPQTAERPGALEAIKCPIDWEASENITSNDGSAVDAYEYEGSDRMIKQFERTDRIIDDRAEKKFERNDHFTSDSIEANTWAFEPINTGFFRDRTLELANTTGTINNLHGLDSNKFGTTPLDFWMQETTRWAYDRYEPFARDPHAELKGTRVGLAARVGLLQLHDPRLRGFQLLSHDEGLVLRVQECGLGVLDLRLVQPLAVRDCLLTCALCRSSAFSICTLCSISM